MVTLEEEFQLAKEYLSEFKESVIPYGLFLLFKEMLSVCEQDIRKNRNRKDAIKWLMSNDTEYLFSFLSICGLLNIDPFQIRLKVADFLKNPPNSSKKNKRKSLILLD